MTYDPTKPGSLRRHQEELAKNTSILTLRLLTGNCTSLPFEAGRRIALAFGYEEHSSTLRENVLFTDSTSSISLNRTTSKIPLALKQGLRNNAREIRRMLRHKLGSPEDF